MITCMLGDKDRLYFTNYDNKDEESLLKEVIKLLKGLGCTVGDKYEIWWVDAYDCAYNDLAFTLIYTGSYVYIKADPYKIPLLQILIESTGQYADTPTPQYAT